MPPAPAYPRILITRYLPPRFRYTVPGVLLEDCGEWVMVRADTPRLGLETWERVYWMSRDEIEFVEPQR